MSTLGVLVVGAAGRMGLTAVRAVNRAADLALVAAVGRKRHLGADVVSLAGVTGPPIILTDCLPGAIASAHPDVGLDFSLANCVLQNARTALAARIPYIVGASGLQSADLQELAQLCARHETPALVVPNFALGAVLMMQFAVRAVSHFEAAEIVELHHAGKLDSPSGTAQATAEAMTGRADGVPIRSVRLSGLLAHQEVLLAGAGEALTIRHDATSPDCYLPGIRLALRRAQDLQGLVVGLDRVL